MAEANPSPTDVPQRVFSYATKWDFVAYGAGVVASIGAGITLPLMNVVFGETAPAHVIMFDSAMADGTSGPGQFVGNFTSFDSMGSSAAARDEFRDKLSRLS